MLLLLLLLLLLKHYCCHYCVVYECFPTICNHGTYFPSQKLCKAHHQTKVSQKVYVEP